ncbi:MAG: hypothetical protein B5M52_00005 [Helicobacteraceae bacterium 4484_230]|nr:MAG: hypothetical protein B5M52_00005 [Helicobacteraceae bacterium 4484_230]
MKKFNLVKEIIVVDHDRLLQAVNSEKSFGITYEGDIKYAPFDSSDIFIYQNSNNTGQSPVADYAALFGNTYQIVEDNERVLIKAAGAWKSIIEINIENAEYDDTSSDGIAEFADKELEDIGWNATEFDINYRELVEKMEESCDGLLFCVEHEGENYHFSGLGYIFDYPSTRKTLFDYCKTRIQELMENNEDFKKEVLDSDQLEATEFFGIIQ